MGRGTGTSANQLLSRASGRLLVCIKESWQLREAVPKTLEGRLKGEPRRVAHNVFYYHLVILQSRRERGLQRTVGRMGAIVENQASTQKRQAEVNFILAPLVFLRVPLEEEDGQKASVTLQRCRRQCQACGKTKITRSTQFFLNPRVRRLDGVFNRALKRRHLMESFKWILIFLGKVGNRIFLYRLQTYVLGPASEACLSGISSHPARGFKCITGRYFQTN